MRKAIKLLSFILISSLLFYISCKEKKDAQEGDIEVIVNENRPQNPSLSLTFKEDLSITKEGWFPAAPAVDDDGNIYVFGEAEMFIYKFDSQGNEIFKKVFPKGQGPGDFYFMDPYFSSDGRLYLYDKLNRRLTILNRDCEIQDTMKFEEARYLLRLDSKGNMFFFRSKSYSRSISKVILTKYSPSGKNLYEIFEFISPHPDFDSEKSTFYWPLYLTTGIYKLDSNDNVYYAMSDKYEINIFSPKGKLVKRIIKKGQSRKVTKKDIEIVKPPVSGTSGVKTEFVAPEHVPYIANFFILGDGYLLVITHENDYEEETLAGDLFDERGIFQAQVEVPKYYYWHHYSEFYGIKKSALYRKKHFYTIESDEHEENFYIKRYKMIWE